MNLLKWKKSESLHTKTTKLDDYDRILESGFFLSCSRKMKKKKTKRIKNGTVEGRQQMHTIKYACSHPKLLHHPGNVCRMQQKWKNATENRFLRYMI